MCRYAAAAAAATAADGSGEMTGDGGVAAKGGGKRAGCVGVEADVEGIVMEGGFGLDAASAVIEAAGEIMGVDAADETAARPMEGEIRFGEGDMVKLLLTEERPLG